MDMNIQSIPNHPPHLYLDFFNARHNAFFFFLFDTLRYAKNCLRMHSYQLPWDSFYDKPMCSRYRNLLYDDN